MSQPARSSKMDSARSATDEDEGEVTWTRRRSIAVLAALVAPFGLLLFVGNLWVLPVVYGVLFIDGIGLAYMAATGSLGAAGRTAFGEEESGPPEARPARDRAQSLASLVKWAAKGSETSRLDMARTVSRLLGQSTIISAGERPATHSRLSDAIGVVVYPFLDDPVVKSHMADLDEGITLGGQTGGPASRGRYLDSLEEIVTSLGPGPDGAMGGDRR